MVQFNCLKELRLCLYFLVFFAQETSKLQTNHEKETSLIYKWCEMYKLFVLLKLICFTAPISKKGDHSYRIYIGAGNYPFFKLDFKNPISRLIL